MANIQNLVPFKAVITPEQYAEARERYLQGESSTTIAESLGCKRGVLDTRFSREGLPAVRAERLKTNRGQRTKDKIAECCENLADGLLGKTPTGAKGMNLAADTLGKVAKAASLVHGWGESMHVAVIVAGDVTGEAEAEPAIDV